MTKLSKALQKYLKQVKPMTNKEMLENILDMEKQYKDIHPKWVYFFAINVWKQLMDLKKKIKK